MSTKNIITNLKKSAKLTLFSVTIPVITWLLPASSAYSAPSPTDLDNQQLILQQERLKALQSTLDAKSPDIHLLPAIKKSDSIQFTTESPCFTVTKVELIDRQALPWFIPMHQLTDQAKNHCLGSEGITLLLNAIQNRLINYGYVTSRVVVPEQDLTTGTLQLRLIPGKIRDIFYSDDSDKHAAIYTAMPARKDKLLNLRDIEQGLENLQRIPTASASMQLVPGNKPGESDVVITRQQSKYWRAGFSLDDSGTRTTGRYQGGLTFYLDNLLTLSDSFYVSGGHDLDHKGKYGTRNYLFSYAVPFGYWLFNASLSGNKYHQTVAGSIVNYEYSGRSRNANFELSNVIHRNESQKTTLSYGVSLRESHNYINESEIEIQQRKTTSWYLGLQHKHYIDDMTLNLGVKYQKGVRWFGAKRAPEEDYVEDKATALSDIINLNLSLAVPFALQEQNFRYNFDYQGQYTRGGNLTSPDQFSIGSRWTVRGFDGELTLKADRGWFIRNELSWQVPFNHELYVGLDTGGVSGTHSETLLGHHLTGSAIGLRGNNYGFYYDLFASAPIKKPEGFRTDDVSLGFNLNWMF
ncbi:ShlB/FhaC/HecB family hemolysin secretion/activation protein [Orbaceae bacterium ESL0721]|nr:ShlB/FhaC/HecB family hemolysin secretion/activation protein [Orbaceae bacterium ESL0721]